MNKQPRMGSDLGKGITPFVVVSAPSTYRHQIYIHNSLEQPDEMIAILDILYSASKEDEVVIHLNSGGGSIDSLDTLLSAIASCPAHIHVVATGTIASAATFILLASDSFEISPFATLLFHACSFGVYGEAQDNLEYVQFVHKESERLMRSYYRHIFTEEEIDDIIFNKRQKWITSKEFEDRFEAAKIKFEAEEKQQNEADQKALAEIYADMEADLELPPDDKLEKQLTKKQLIALLKGDVDLKYDEASGKIELIKAEE